MRPADTELTEGHKSRDPATTANGGDDLKVKINNLIWMHGPETLTLCDAESLSVKIMQAIYSGTW